MSQDNNSSLGDVFSSGPEDVWLEADGKTHVLQQNGSVLSADNPATDTEALRVKVKRELHSPSTIYWHNVIADESVGLPGFTRVLVCDV